jgi:8-oxo-dGTP pyrophosphatase MutT (NUDIX family)
MKSRIRVGVLLFKDDAILLLRHVDPDTGYEWWVPPGGGIKDAESIFEAAVREVNEETGLKASAGRVVYCRQFISEQYCQNNLDTYILGEIESGIETTENLHCLGTNDSRFIKEWRYFSEHDIKSINVFPKVLQHDMWAHRRAGFPQIVFLGVQHDKE